MFTRILIANRGEIARRIIRTCKRLGVETVAVYADNDADMPFVREADVRIALHGHTSADTYLDIEKILQAAQVSGAQAIHPGYGFLSENTAFASACEEAGICFIGPRAEAIELMGDKAAARLHMQAHDVPVLPGFDKNPANDQELAQAAADIGFPLLIKAVAGGGGKGMRVVEQQSDFKEALASARREAKAAFGDDRVLLEKYITLARHVEVQVFADQQGQAVHLFERDCSIQRRHQKIIEEAPAPGLSEETRSQMGEAAVRACQSIQYEGAGTVEFLLTPDNRFYFMEMNTRLQVEHPVTEYITGLDLVEWQLAVANGAPLPCLQQDIHRHGHAMEVRIYAESPEKGFLPSTGQLQLADWPTEQESIRVDEGYETGNRVSERYDPMISKIISFGEDREQARLRLLQALHKTRLAGIDHNIPFLCDILQMPAFRECKLDTGFLDKNPRPQSAEQDEQLAQQALVACAMYLAYPSHASSQDTSQRVSQDPWINLTGWRPLGRRHWHFHLQLGQQHHQVSLDQQKTQSAKTYVSLDGQLLDMECERIIEPETVQQSNQSAPVGKHKMLQISLKTHSLNTSDLNNDTRVQNTGPQQAESYYDWSIYSNPHTGDSGAITLFAFYQGHTFPVLVSPDHDEGELDQQSHRFTAPMSGTIVSLHQNSDSMVEEGAPVITMEAMKMEHTLYANEAGHIQRYLFQPGDTVKEGEQLVEFNPLTDETMGEN